MSIVSTGGLLDALRQTALLSREQLSQVNSLPEARGEARSFAKLLVQRGWLSIFQINELLAGKAASLVIGPYHVLDRLGQGGLSAVYKARHSELQSVVALKVIQAEVIANAEGRRQFLLEMDAMARLDHPNIVQFCDTNQSGDAVYFAMEYVEGTDLGKYVRLGGHLPAAQACDFIRQTALGLQHAHERNLVHRDIKPVNLYMTQVGQIANDRYGRPIAIAKPKQAAVIKILDWGLASLRAPRGMAGPEMVEHLATGIVGTADYLSPEQARNAQSVDIRGDIYSLGCTLYYLLTGQPPFPEGSLMQKLLQHQNADPESIDSFRDDVPIELIAIVKRMMAKQAEHRFQTPAAVALAMMPFARNADLSEMPVQTAPRTHLTARTRDVGDQTPLPGSLVGRPGTPTSRLPKAGKIRTVYKEMDTASAR